MNNNTSSTFAAEELRRRPRPDRSTQHCTEVYYIYILLSLSSFLCGGFGGTYKKKGRRGGDNNNKEKGKGMIINYYILDDVMIVKDMYVCFQEDT